MDNLEHNNPIRCPRCGYDQRGTVATWRELCPLDGICNECGLPWHWAELLSDRIRRPTWCVEFPLSLWQIVTRSVRTILMMARPNRFWAELTMMTPFRPLHMSLFWILAIAPFYLYFPITAAREAARGANSMSLSFSAAAPSIAYAAIFPFSTNPPAWYVKASYRVQKRSLTYPFVSLQAPVPADCVSSLNGVWPSFYDFQVALVVRRLRPLGFSDYALVALVTGLLIPAGFIVLPRSRTRSSVRWNHLARVAAYSIVPLFLIVDGEYLRRACWPLNWTWDVQLAYVVLLVIGMPIFYIVWWRSAIRYYLRMPHAWLISISLTIMAWLFFWMTVIGLTIWADL